MPRNHYIFIDYENVCENELSRIVGKPAKVFLILGIKHKKLPVDYTLFAQNHPGQLRFIQTPVDGHNALDLVLTLELGRILAADPEGYFHIISKDNDFKSIVSHLKSEKKLIARHSSLTEIPALRLPKKDHEPTDFRSTHGASSNDMEQLFLPEIQQCPLITNLAAIAGETPDPDGWSPLKAAIQRLQDFPSEKIDALCQQFGHTSLSRLLAASQVFELQVDQRGKGKHRMLYRLKHTVAETCEE
jgi:hypothetical protein